MAARDVTIAARNEWRVWRVIIPGPDLDAALANEWQPFAGYSFDGSEVVLLRKLVEVTPSRVVSIKALDGGLDKAG